VNPSINCKIIRPAKLDLPSPFSEKLSPKANLPKLATINQMQAHILRALKTPLVIEEISNPQPAPNAVVIRLKAAALNRRDYWITQGRYPGITFPIVLGSDGVGTVEKVGAEVDNYWGNQEVIINPGWDWGDREEAQSDQFTILGLPNFGTLGELVHVPAKYVHPKPAHLDTNQAAAIPLAGVTAYRGIFSRGGLKAGENVLVTGIGGGVATFAVQYAAAAGAKVFVTSSSPAKLERARQLGATAGFLYTDANWRKSLVEEYGMMDLIYDGAGGAGYGELIEAARPGGRIVNYGGTAGAPEKFDIFRVYWKQLSLLGSTMGSEADFGAMLHFVSSHNLSPIIDQVFDWPDANSALKRLCNCAQFGKIVIKH
jgi:NADPH:quinone reductase-like Zn-dependent oxidoreductase